MQDKSELDEEIDDNDNDTDYIEEYEHKTESEQSGTEDVIVRDIKVHKYEQNLSQEEEVSEEDMNAIEDENVSTRGRNLQNSNDNLAITQEDDTNTMALREEFNGIILVKITHKTLQK